MRPIASHINSLSIALLWGFFAFITPNFSQAQTSTECSVSGTIKGDDGNTLVGASLFALENPRFGTSADVNGKFNLTLPHKGPWTLKCSMVGYTTKEIPLVFKNGSSASAIFVILESTVKLNEAEVSGESDKNTTIRRIDPRVANRIPTPRGTIEDVLLQAPR